VVAAVASMRLGMFPFKVQLFQGYKSETEPINTKSVVQHVIRYQVLLAAYYKADAKHCWRHKDQLFRMLIAFTKKHMNEYIKCVDI
jgi:hypothetical protein